MIITIGRKCGCCGDEIGHALEQIYHIPFYDRSVISELAKGYGMYDRYPDFYGETPMDTLMYTISQTESENVFYETPKKALSEILDGKNCIILGRCGNYVFKDRKDKLAIFLTGDDAMRIESIAKKHGIPERQAKKLVQATDERREAYHKYYTGETWGMAENYDLCLNVSKLGTAGTIAMIEQYIRQTGLALRARRSVSSKFAFTDPSPLTDLSQLSPQPPRRSLFSTEQRSPALSASPSILTLLPLLLQRA